MILAKKLSEEKIAQLTRLSHAGGSVYVPGWLIDVLGKEVRRQGRKMTEVVRRALILHFKDQRPVGLPDDEGATE